MGRALRDERGRFAYNPDAEWRARADANAHRSVRSAAAGGNVSLSVSIDLRQIEDLQRAMVAAGRSYEQEGRRVIVRSVNYGLGLLRTQMKRGLTQWAGANRQAQIDAALKVDRASMYGAGDISGRVYLSTNWAKITRGDFGATWQRGDAGVKHNAWGRSQTARGAFMLPGVAVAFHRVFRGKGGLKPLYGPNLAREIERHAREVQAMQAVVLRPIADEMLRQAAGAIDHGARRVGL